MLYKKDIVVPIASQFFKINFSNSPNKKTRDILYLKANINKTDTIHILINHWSSRLGGQEKSEIYRLNAARILKQITDSILTINPLANILITGDFNDTPINNSIQLFSSLASEFINLSGSNTDSKKGSIKYEGRWYWFDQILVTKIMVSGNCSLCIQADRSILFNPDFLLEEDSKYFGYKPFKTYNGMHYIGGFSDHLPVFTDIRFTKQ